MVLRITTATSNRRPAATHFTLSYWPLTEQVSNLVMHGRCFGKLGVPVLAAYNVFNGSLPYQTAKPSVSPIFPKLQRVAIFILTTRSSVALQAMNFAQLVSYCRFLLSSASHHTFLGTCRRLAKVYTLVNDLDLRPSPPSMSTFGHMPFRHNLAPSSLGATVCSPPMPVIAI